MSGQIELIGVITNWLTKERGIKEMNSRQYNAVIKAADIVIDAMNKPHESATEGMGLKAWLASDDTGVSSRYMAAALAPLAGLPPWIPKSNHFRPFPHDPADFGRCVRLLEAVPELRPHIAELADPKHGHVWNAIAAEWETLEQWYTEDLPSGRSYRVCKRLQEMDKEGLIRK